MTATAPTLEALLSRPRLTALLPLLHAVWEDGELTEAELSAIRASAAAFAWLTPEERGVLQAWLTPAQAPGALAISRLGEHLRRLSAQQTAAASLSALGVALARAVGPEALPPGDSAQLLQALTSLEGALGVDGASAVRQLLPVSPAPEGPPAPAFSAEVLRALALRRYPEARARVLSTLTRPDFRYVDERDTKAYREQVLRWLKTLADEGLGALAFAQASGDAPPDLGAFIAAFETLAFFDLSLTVKAGVHFGLFGGSLLFLGSDAHRQEVLPKVARLELPGCFAMSELAHGSNVRDLQTRVRYAPESGEFILHTPNEGARKEWIGNAALHARVATVFAQLETGGEPRGVHAFLVPLRDEEGRVLPGIRIEDCGLKMGLNGVDNGRIWFDQVRLPRSALLSRFAEVTPEGEYRSPIRGDSKRFFTMLGTLVAGRVSVACASNSVAKSALTIAVRYGQGRRQFGPPGQPEVRLLDYPIHQKRLLVPLSRAWALHFALEGLVQRYVGRTEADAQEVEALAAGLKAYASWNATRTVQEAREACGGQGYLVANRLPALKADSDIFSTFEGDNTVLLQLVAKGLLTGFRQRFEDDRVFTVLRMMLARASTLVQDQNPLAARRTASEHLRDDAFLGRMLAFREESLLSHAVRRLGRRVSGGMDAFSAFHALAPHLQALALAHVERGVYEAFRKAVGEVEDAALAPVLGRLCDVYGLSCLEADMAWFLENGVLEAPKARAVRKEVLALCAELRPDAVALVEGFGIPQHLLAAPIAAGEFPGGGRVA